LPVGSPEPGPWRSSRTPYIPPIFAALRTYTRAVVITSAQMGKTSGLLNLIGQKLDDDPAPILYIGPTKSNVDRVIEPQITQMLRSAPSLWAKTDRSRRAQKLAKTVAGVSLRLAWAGSPTELASQPAHTILVDELDRMEPVPGEGDVMTMAEARKTNYADGRIIATSTPTEGNVDVERNPETGIEHWKLVEGKDLPSAIWKLFQEGTRFEWAVPCPECRAYFIPRFRLLYIPPKATPQEARRDARLICQHCGVQLEDSCKAAMNAAGRYLAPGQSVVDGKVVGPLPETDTASFWASGLMSPWRTWGQRAASWVRAHASGDQERRRAVINLEFGELYAFIGEAPKAEIVQNCEAPYKLGTVPQGVRWIQCGVDVQKQRLVYAVRGFGPDLESWLIDHGEIWGETEHADVWMQLGEFLERPYDGKPIQRMGIDSGYRPGDKWRRPENMVYDFCMRYPGRVLATKGRDRMDKPLYPSLIDVTWRGKTYTKGLQLWHLNSDYFKQLVYTRLTYPEGQKGRFWVPEDVSDDYCQQLTAEARVIKPSGLAVWVRVRKENHYLDTEAINFAMAYSLGLHRRRTPAVVESAKTAEGDAPEGAVRAARQKIPRMPARNWTTEW
jgi:phage terminase large subunit GpA-like protein